MKRYLPKNAEDASALILTLLVIVLLSAIVTSFLSSARTEQTATRNYTSKVQAEMFANSATQQAMAKIQQGFTVGTGNTTVITTQPGAIKKYFFSNGTLQTSSTITTELFTTGSGNLTNLNNLQNPGNSTSNATSNQWTITGNVSEQINVPMENITSNGTIVGRIAYYVDDEGTKLNLNAATGDRTTLNAAIRPSDIGALSASDTNIFASIVNGTASNNTSNATTWSHFFRSEQVGAAINSAGGNFSQENLPYITTATTSASSTANITHLLTPWGTQRIPINTLSTNATDGTGDTSVISIFEAFTGLNGTSMNAPSNSTYGLTGQGLQNIFGGDFSTKYTSLGVKQIAANMLQMRSPNTSTVSASFSYNGALLGSKDLDADGLPKEYLGYAPYPIISEIGFSCLLCYAPAGTTTNSTTDNKTNITTTVTTVDPYIRVNIQPTVELYNPYPYPFVFESGYPRLMIKFKDMSFDLSYTYPPNNPDGPKTVTVKTGVDLGPPFDLPATGFGLTVYAINVLKLTNPEWNPPLNDNDVFYDALAEFLPKNDANKPYIPAKTKIQTHFAAINWGYTFNLKVKGGGTQTQTNKASKPKDKTTTVPYSDPVKINGVSNATIEINNVKILANSNIGASDIYTGQENTIRDWVTGNETGWIKADIPPATIGTKSLPYTTDGVTNVGPPWLQVGNRIIPSTNKNGPPSGVPTYSASRVSFFNKYPVSGAVSGNQSNWYNPDPGAPSWSVSSSSLWGNQGNATADNPNNANSSPSTLSAQEIPSDPSLGDSLANAVFAGSDASDMREPYLVTGNYTGPADLGFVPTNQRWRRLRMQMQPTQEVSNSDGGNGNQTYIPDWAMLDVISFGNSTNANDPFTRQHPVNINGRFYLPGSASITPRTVGLQALAKVLEISTGGTIQDPMNPASSNFTDTMRFRGNTINATMVVNNIRNMSWSTSSTWGNRRSNKNFPADQYILPSEIMEIAGVANEVDQTNYTNNSTHFKWNEGRASALIPAVTTRSSFFTIFAYAQALDKQGNIDSEALTKTLVEVEIVTAATSNGTTTTPAQYKVKKLYTQPILMGD